MADVEKLAELHQASRIPPADLVGTLPRGNIDLAYLGHAAVTDILLGHDPEWDWEPLAWTDRGMPAVVLDKDGWPVGLWIRLTVHGHSRLGYGTCRPGKEDAIKELIGDALRNAAMRFGVAVSLWAKEEWADQGISRKEVSASTGGSRSGAGPSGDQRDPEDNGPGPGNVTPLPKPTKEDIARHPAGGPSLPPDQAIAARAQKLGLADEERRQAISIVTAGRTESGKDVRPQEVRLIMAELEAMAKAKRRG